MTREMLNEFISDSFFNIPVTLVTKVVTRSKGRVIDGIPIEKTINCVIQSVKEKDLVNNGLGQFTDRQAFSVFTKEQIDQSENNLIRFHGKLFKIRRTGDWVEYGFNKYIIYQYNDTVLNDN